MIERLALYCKERGATLLLTSPANLVKGESAGAEAIADVLIALWFDTSGEYIERRLAILKVRGELYEMKKMKLELSRDRVGVKWRREIL